MMHIAARLACLALLCSGACAQSVQNLDISFMFGAPAFGSSITVNPAVKVDLERGGAIATAFGCQVARFSAATLFVEVAPLSVFRRGDSAGISGSVLNNFSAWTLRGRLMLPVQSRVSAYVALGGGGGKFYYTSVDPGDPARLRSNRTTHGVLDLAGGVDVRLTQMLSVRVEARDIVSGRGLSGATGRHHLVPLAGFAMHF